MIESPEERFQSPGGEDGSLRCDECGSPATWQVVHDGCRYCGGVDCSDSGDIEYGCAEHPYELAAEA